MNTELTKIQKNNKTLPISNIDNLELSNTPRKLNPAEKRYLLSGMLQSMFGNEEFKRKFNLTQSDLNKIADFLEKNDNALDFLKNPTPDNLANIIPFMSMQNSTAKAPCNPYYMLKQKELEKEYGYDNTLCYVTSLFNLYRKNKLMSNEQIDSFMRSPQITRYIKPDGSIINFQSLSKAIARHSGSQKYYDYVYPKEIGRQQLFQNKDDFEKSNYNYGIGEYYKTPDFGITADSPDPKPDHFELIENNPYGIINPGQKDDYYQRRIRPVNLYNLPKDN